MVNKLGTNKTSQLSTAIILVNLLKSGSKVTSRILADKTGLTTNCSRRWLRAAETIMSLQVEEVPHESGHGVENHYRLNK